MAPFQNNWLNSLSGAYNQHFLALFDDATFKVGKVESKRRGGGRFSVDAVELINVY